MNSLEEKVQALNEAVKERNILTQISTIAQINAVIEHCEDHDQIIRELLSLNLGAAITNMICCKLIVLEPAMKLLLNFMDNYDFRGYQFLPILQNIFRALVFFVHGDEMEKSQLEFFDVITILDVLMEKYLQHDFSTTPSGDMKATFVCVMKFIELILSKDTVQESLKTVMVDIYLHLLKINKMFKCTFHSFDLTTKMANLGDEFLGRLLTKYKREKREMWVYKIFDVLLKVFESFIVQDNKCELTVRVFEHFFSCHVGGILTYLMSPDSVGHDPQLFKLFISTLNAVLWTPAFSQEFYLTILKKCVKKNVDSKAFLLSKFSRKISSHTSFTMKIFLTALVVHSRINIFDKHKVLNTFLQCNLFDSIFEIKTRDILKNYKAVVLLYTCSFLKDKLSGPLNARRVVENLVTILRNPQCPLKCEEIWMIASSFCYFSHKAVFSQLEAAGVQKTSEILVEHVAKIAFNPNWQGLHIDKHLFLLAKETSTHGRFINALTFMYLSQQPTYTSAKVNQLIPARNLLPLLTSSDRNQVENAVKLLAEKPLTADDMNFIVEQSFANVKSEEAVIGAAIHLINLNLSKITEASVVRIFRGTLAFFEAKQITEKGYSKECYMCLLAVCANLVKSNLSDKCDCGVGISDCKQSVKE